MAANDTVSCMEMIKDSLTCHHTHRELQGTYFGLIITALALTDVLCYLGLMGNVPKNEFTTKSLRESNSQSQFTIFHDKSIVDDTKYPYWEQYVIKCQFFSK